jgi:alkylhydroperoxidase family enzyme
VARIEPVPAGEWPEEMREALAALVPAAPRHTRPSQEGRPKGLNVLGTFAHHPELARAFFTFNGHVQLATSLTPRQRELLILRVAAVRTARYEWAQHVLIAGDAGLDDEEIRRIGDEPDAPAWGELEGALLRAVDELLDDGAISDETWRVLSREFSPQQLLDVIFTVGAYETLAFMERSFGLEFDDDLIDVSDREPWAPSP